MIRALLLATLAAAAMPARPAAAESIAGPVPAEVVAVVDGDTLKVRAHVWLGMSIDVLVRIRGIDTPELRARCPGERSMAEQATGELGRAVTDGRVSLANVEGDKYYGRVLADVVTPSGADLREVMMASGLARSYDGGARQGWCADVSG
jgi:endonuclease YncB( thermonuclease family)